MGKNFYSEKKCRKQSFGISKVFFMFVILIGMSGIFGLSQVHAGDWNEVDNHPDDTGELIVYNGKLLVGTSGHVHSFNGGTWTEMSDSPEGVKSFAIYNGSLYAAASDKVWKYDGIQWTQVSDPLLSQIHRLAVNNGLLYAGQYTKPASLYKYDGNDWTTIADRSLNLITSMTFDEDNNLYVGDSSGITKYDGTNGTPIPDSPEGSIIIYFKGTLYAGALNENVSAYDGGTWTSLSDDTLTVQSFHVIDETLYGGGMKGLYTLNGEDVTFLSGSPKWVSSMAEYDDTLYVRSPDGLFSFQPASTTALDDALTDANRKLTDHSEGTGVGHTSKETRATLQDAIDTAQVVADDAANKTQAQVDEATDTLNDAISVFEDEIIKAGDPTTLNETLNNAKQKKADHPEGTGVDEVSKKAHDTLQDAIKVAQAVADDVANKTQAELDTAATTLENAITAFEDEVMNVGDPTTLNETLNNAKQKKANHPEGTGVGEVSKEARDTLQDAIRAAQAVVNDTANKTQVELDMATATLQEAITAFVNSVHDKKEEQPVVNPQPEKDGGEATPPEDDNDGLKERGNSDTKTDPNEDGNALPVTATTIYTWLMMGSVLLVLGLILFGMYRFRTRQQ